MGETVRQQGNGGIGPIPFRETASWQRIDELRRQIADAGGDLTRVEFCRRAGISESTYYRGLKQKRRPIASVRRQVHLVLEAQRMLLEGERADV